MMRYLRLLGVRLRLSIALGMQYRADFLIGALTSLLWIGLGIVPLFIALHARPAIAGWTFPRALVVIGWFTLLKAVLDGAVSPSLVAVVEQIRLGTLDFVLMKPADAQFLVSTTKFDVWKSFDVIAAVALVAIAFRMLGATPSLAGVCAAIALLAAAVLLLYAIWILIVSAAFWVVKLDNLAFLFSSIFDFARWPVSVFKGVARFVFTFVFPIGVMTTYPAEALLGTLRFETGLAAIGGSLAFATLARIVWVRALGRYASASS